jgi:hypothetical protein
MAENKSSNLKQTCVNCHFFAYAMKNYNPKSDQYSLKVVDEYYRNWIKEKCYNYNQSTEIPEECNYLHGYDNEKAPDRYFVGLKCYKNVWPGERFIGLSMERIPRTPDMKTCSFLYTVPMYREKAFEEITEVDRSNSCFFREYKPGMSFEAAEELERREAQNKGERTKTEDRQQKGEVESVKVAEEKKRNQRIPDKKFKQLCKEVERNHCTRASGEIPFFRKLSEVSKLPKYDKTGRGYKTWQSTKSCIQLYRK